MWLQTFKTPINVQFLLIDIRSRITIQEDCDRAWSDGAANANRHQRETSAGEKVQSTLC